MFYVYQLKSSRCSKVYIGVTTDIDRRFKQHLNVAKHKWKTLTACGRAVKRYGPDTFSIRVLETADTSLAAAAIEEKWISRFGKKRLWNRTSGGYGNRKRKSK